MFCSLIRARVIAAKTQVSNSKYQFHLAVIGSRGNLLFRVEAKASMIRPRHGKIDRYYHPTNQTDRDEFDRPLVYGGEWSDQDGCQGC